MKMIFPNMIEAVTLIFGVSRSIRGEVAMEGTDPKITEIFGMVAMTKKMENGTILVMSIDADNPDPAWQRNTLVPSLLMDFDFVFHVADGILYEAHDKEEVDLLKAHLFCRDIEIGDMKKSALFGTLYSRTKIMAKAIATQPEYVAFHMKNSGKDFPDAKLPNSVEALWRLVDPECLDSHTQFEPTMAKQIETIDWN